MINKIKYLAILFLIAFSFSYQCYTNHFYNTIGSQTIEDLSDEDIGEASKYIVSGMYIQPNEGKSNVFYSQTIANKEGTLISVGTFRALIGFTIGKFDRLIMLDIDRGILDFNREQLNYIDTLSKEYPNDIETERKKYYQKYEKYLSGLPEFHDKLYYWNNNDKYQKIVNAIKENKINVISGDFGNTKNNASLYSAIKNLNTDITLDVSNVKEHVFNLNDFKATLKDFANASKDKNASVLVTTSTPFAYGLGDKYKVYKFDWDYYYFPTVDEYTAILH